MTSDFVERLEKVSDEAIRRVLIALCESNPDFEKNASKCLDAFISDEYRSHLDGTERQQVSAGTKRKADDSLPDVFVCENCGDGFLEEHNDDEACFHHPGNLEVDEDSGFWADHDENCHGVIDTDDMRKALPDGFFWDCCGERGDGKRGCEYARHEAIGSKRRKPNEKPGTPVTIDLTDD